MNLLDVLLLLPLMYGFYTGYSKGLISQLTGLIGGILSILFGIKLSGYLKSYLTESELVNPEWSGVVGFVFTVIGIFLVLKLAGSLVRKTTKTIGLGFIEKLAGGVLGMLKYLMITLAILFFFVKMNSFLNITPQETFVESKLYLYYQQVFEYLYHFWKPNDNINLT